jgi:hypothetical protein
VSQERLNRVFHAAVAEVAQKRISGTEGKKSQGWTLTVESLGIETVHDFVRGAVATDRDEVTHSPAVSIAGNVGGIGGGTGFRHVDIDAAGSQTIKSGAEKFAALSATCCRIYDR